jgi:hypothetical protein
MENPCLGGGASTNALHTSDPKISKFSTAETALKSLKLVWSMVFSVDLIKNFDRAGPSGSIAQAAGILTSINSLDIIYPDKAKYRIFFCRLRWVHQNSLGHRIG